ncbi:LAGLIDADG family homing endonuclease [Bacillus sp. Marseille-Q1617]|uniref:LAGLIDADG family homing endonuclease n=1 Tax=Bacillus sp. Marseille-Q1617 TaxID=2736887 RepID=UPI00158D0932|nr:LAGLIDADG family homing endonuclease [Bacillus sp. Marseille-Q1617]
MAKKKCTLEAQEMVKLYEEGMRTVEIAEMSNVSPRYVNNVLRKNNVKRRAKGSWKRKYTVNEHYFKTWTNNMAYILVFFAADGSVNKDFSSISFYQKNIEILERIKIELQSNHPLVQNPNTGVYALGIHSKILKDDLMTLHGIQPNKSLSIQLPTIPEPYLNHFVRGYFDGDGSISKSRNCVCIVSGSIDFSRSLHKIFESHKLKPRLKEFETYYRIYITGHDNISLFANWIYKDKDLYLVEKYKRFLEKQAFMRL